MSECNNIFDEFIKKFFIKFDKLQIEGFHTKRGMYGDIVGIVPRNSMPQRQYNSVSPNKRAKNMGIATNHFNVHPNVLAKNALDNLSMTPEQDPT